jgi:hypothetical protein
MGSDEPGMLAATKAVGANSWAHSDLQIRVSNRAARDGIECAGADKSSHVPHV